MSTLSAVAVLLVLALGGVIFALRMYGVTRRTDERLRLPQMVQRLGAGGRVPVTETDVREAASATRRCMRCNSKALCDEWLGSPGRGTPIFCPNLPYLQRLRHHARAFR